MELKNYTVVEVDKIDCLISNDLTYNWSVLLILFLIIKINKELTQTDKSFRLFLVKLDYHGEYPAIGIQYFDFNEDQVDEIELSIINMVNIYLSQSNIIDFVNFFHEEEGKFIKSEITHFNKKKWFARGYR